MTSDELSETVLNSSDGYSQVSHKIVIDTPVKPNKRTGKAMELIEEESVFDIYKINRTSFKSTGPMTWTAAAACNRAPMV